MTSENNRPPVDRSYERALLRFVLPAIAIAVLLTLAWLFPIPGGWLGGLTDTATACNATADWTHVDDGVRITKSICIHKDESPQEAVARIEVERMNAKAEKCEATCDKSQKEMMRADGFVWAVRSG